LLEEWFEGRSEVFEKLAVKVLSLLLGIVRIDQEVGLTMV